MCADTHTVPDVCAHAGYNLLRPTVQHLCVHTMQRSAVSTSCLLRQHSQASLPAAGQQTCPCAGNAQKPSMTPTCSSSTYRTVHMLLCQSQSTLLALLTHYEGVRACVLVLSSMQFGHRVKSVTLADYSAHEVEQMQQGGNQVRHRWRMLV